MPDLVRLYIRHCLIGFAIAGVFTGGLLWLNVANLQHLVFNASGGALAAFLLFFFNGLLFAGVQFGIAVMGMAETPDRSGGAASRIPMADIFGPEPVRIPIPARDEPAARR
jgi:hypothetical protein